jgi:hypothetical protein
METIKEKLSLEERKKALIEELKRKGEYTEPLTQKDIQKIVEDAYREHGRL